MYIYIYIYIYTYTSTSTVAIHSYTCINNNTIYMVDIYSYVLSVDLIFIACIRSLWL